MTSEYVLVFSSNVVAQGRGRYFQRGRIADRDPHNIILAATFRDDAFFIFLVAKISFNEPYGRDLQGVLACSRNRASDVETGTRKSHHSDRCVISIVLTLEATRFYCSSGLRGITAWDSVAVAGTHSHG